MDRAHRVILVSERVTKVDEHAVAEILGDVSVEALGACGAGLLIGGHHFGQGFGIETLGELGGVDQVAEHHGELAVLALGNGRGRGYRRRRRGSRLRLPLLAGRPGRDRCDPREDLALPGCHLLHIHQLLDELVESFVV